MNHSSISNKKYRMLQFIWHMYFILISKRVLNASTVFSLTFSQGYLEFGLASKLVTYCTPEAIYFISIQSTKCPPKVQEPHAQTSSCAYISWKLKLSTRKPIIYPGCHRGMKCKAACARGYYKAAHLIFVLHFYSKRHLVSPPQDRLNLNLYLTYPTNPGLLYPAKYG